MATTLIQDLFETIRKSFPESLPQDSWYIPSQASALLATDGGENFAALYKYAIKQLGPGSSSEARKNVSRRLREVIIKTWTLLGLPKVFPAYYSLASAEAPGDAAADFERSERRANLHPDEVSARGQDWIERELADDGEVVRKSLSTNPDLAWTMKFIQYGYFFADTSVLGTIENEMCILAALMGQGAQIATFVHMKSLRRLGASKSEAEAFQDVVVKVAVFQGKNTSSWHRFEEIEHLFE
ncbi:uncharacterized protein BDZ99DRAFT_445287 [Mytilinidion resinicola]|uniref:Carboxymuconolactone decarboxylase n=1 Tax=Mytilinidion resinicola TaxID=574789 RepID=A0A6A6YJM7_9PEZI|nr:uncharacterized protein BDZ99DRAFT_445287 [Mytilinidion resinicola]KAF2808127.1 hypothetical protein BDZ99DRAFT_445287 [Mytilinidion resinicola]